VDPAQQNAQLDAQLLKTGAVDRGLFLRLSDAHGYGAASTVGWVEAKLAVLGKALDEGKQLSLFAPDGAVTAMTHDELGAWAARHFPDACAAQAETLVPDPPTSRQPPGNSAWRIASAGVPLACPHCGFPTTIELRTYVPSRWGPNTYTCWNCGQKSQFDWRVRLGAACAAALTFALYIGVLFLLHGTHQNGRMVDTSSSMEVVVALLECAICALLVIWLVNRVFRRFGRLVAVGQN